MRSQSLTLTEPRVGRAIPVWSLRLLVPAASVGLGLLVASGSGPRLVWAIVGAGCLALLARRPAVGASVALAVVASIPLLIGTVATEVGPLSVHWTDLALMLLAASAAVALHSRSGTDRERVRAGVLLVLPLVGVVVLRGILSVLDGATLAEVGVGFRAYAWFAAIPAFAAVTSDRAWSGRQLLAVATLLAAATALLVLAGNLDPAIGDVVSRVTGGRLVALPGYTAVLNRVVLPGMTLVPMMLALALGKLVYDPGRGRGVQLALVALFTLALLVTFARGMWAWTMVALLIVLLVRGSARTVAVTVAVGVVLVAVLLAADVLVGRAPGLPGGLLEMARERVDRTLAGDANIDIRLLENRQVVRQTDGHELLGLGPSEDLGVFYSAPESTYFTVHNSYYAIYGRIGLLGLAGLLMLLGGVVVTGVRALRSASPAEAPVVFAALFGFLRGALSAWTQQDLSTVTGIAVMCLCAALLLTSRREELAPVTDVA